MTDTRTLIERTEQRIRIRESEAKFARENAEAAGGGLSRGLLHNAKTAEQEVALLRDLLAALPQAQTFSSTCVCGHPELRHFYQPTKRGACMEEGCDCEETRLRKQPAAPPAPDARLRGLQDAAYWVLNVASGIGFSGGAPSDGEYIEAMNALKDAREASLRAHEGEK